VDLVDVLSGLGCRIGELLALDWTNVDDEAGTLMIEGTVIHIPGHGLIVQPHTKSKAVCARSAHRRGCSTCSGADTSTR